MLGCVGLGGVGVCVMLWCIWIGREFELESWRPGAGSRLGCG